MGNRLGRASSRKKRTRRFERLEKRLLLAADPFGQNPLQPLDVTRDGIVNETDANALIANPRLLACQAW